MTENPRGMRITVHGTVQGVGFRPFVHRLATELGVRGEVRNTGGKVLITATATTEILDKFRTLLVERAPEYAVIERLDAIDAPPATVTGFSVVASDATGGTGPGIPPDLATCPACVRELFDPTNRRYRYPFITCTDCGPRVTIVDALPYDRANTTMRTFPMCPRCMAEYRDPTDRRFHAEPIACPDCGPQLAWLPGSATGEAALAAAVRVIAAGGIIAVKGIGGYQLVCDAGNEATVARLRTVKHRPAKPFAVMVPSLTAARELSTVDDMAAVTLRSAAAPIVLLPRRADAPLAASIAPAVREIGLFLPYSPLHHLLLAELARPLVVTSGNRAGEPIAIDDATARATLGPIVDGVLGHDRPIRSRYDDSVVRIRNGRIGMVRLARGYSPKPLPLPRPAPEPVLALGAQLKHTATLAVGDRALIGPHTGDLSDTATYEAFRAGLRRLCDWYDAEPRVCAHDPHPDYLSTRYARHWPADRRIPVQHHHAHVAATAAEHGVTERFVGVAYDGLGLGDDGTLWGGEILLADYRGYRRVGRFGTAPLPGGAAAVRRPARMALGYLFGAEDHATIPEPLIRGVLGRMDAREVSVIRAMIAQRVNCPLASSAGRLFDAVAALLDSCADTSYEGEAAIRLETAAAGQPDGKPLAWRLIRRDGLHVYDPAPTLIDLLRAARDAPVSEVAARFHTTIAEVTVALVERAAADSGTHTVCLGGGVFQNVRLADAVTGRLTALGFAVHVGERVPVNDAGISYGQAAIAAARLAKG